MMMSDSNNVGYNLQFQYVIEVLKNGTVEHTYDGYTEEEDAVAGFRAVTNQWSALLSRDKIIINADSVTGMKNERYKAGEVLKYASHMDNDVERIFILTRFVTL